MEFRAHEMGGSLALQILFSGICSVARIRGLENFSNPH